MKKTRIRSTQKAITREEAQELVSEIAFLTNHNRIGKAEMDERILSIRKEYEFNLNLVEEKIKMYSGLVQAWADQNPEEFGKKKSVDFPAGKVGFRTGTPKAKTLAGWTWGRVLEKLKSLTWGGAYVRVKEEIDKEGIISGVSQGTITPVQVREIGCKVEQDEAFFIEPDLTPFENRIKEAV